MYTTTKKINEILEKKNSFFEPRQFQECSFDPREFSDLSFVKLEDARLYSFDRRCRQQHRNTPKITISMRLTFRLSKEHSLDYNYCMERKNL